MPIGTFINIFAVCIGSIIGLVLRKNFPEKIKAIVFQGLGLCTLLGKACIWMPELIL